MHLCIFARVCIYTPYTLYRFAVIKNMFPHYMLYMCFLRFFICTKILLNGTKSVYLIFVTFYDSDISSIRIIAVLCFSTSSCFLDLAFWFTINL